MEAIRKAIRDASAVKNNRKEIEAIMAEIEPKKETARLQRKRAEEEKARLKKAAKAAAQADAQAEEHRATHSDIPNGNSFRALLRAASNSVRSRMSVAGGMGVSRVFGGI